MKPRAHVAAFTFAVLLGAAATAHAHLMTTGLGPFYDGFTHLFLTPEDLLPVLALAMLAGLCGPAAGRAALFAVPVAWLVGACAAAALAPHDMPPALGALLAIAFGGFVAADPRLPRGVVLALALALGGLAGALGGSALVVAHAGLSGAAGVVASLFVAIALVAGLVASLERASARIAVRVAGSWVAASGLLMLGWALRSD